MDFYTNSMLKDWSTCRNKYYYKYVKRIVIPQKEENFELGRKVHALISYKLNGFDTNILEKTADINILEHYHSILNHPILSQDTFLAEWGFNVSIGQTSDMFMGRIDAVFYDKKKNIYTIADWKTGMKIPEIPNQDVQAQIYLYSLYKSQNDLKIKIKPEQLRFSFIQTPSLLESSFEFSQGLFDEFEEYFFKTINDIKQYTFIKENQNNKHCKYCEYRFICNKQN